MTKKNQSNLIALSSAIDGVLWHPKICISQPNPNVMVFGSGGFGSSLGHEVGALTNGISALIKENQRASTHCPPCKSTRRRCCPWSKKQVITRYQTSGALTLDFTASQTVRNKCLLSKPPSLWYFITAAQMD